jgi:hypothetical protein
MLIWISACGSDDAQVEACASLQSPTCTPQYEPTFENVFHRTLSPSCALAGRSCHGAEGAQGGIVFDDIDKSYALLIEGAPGDTLRIDRDDPGCGELIQRIESADASLRMPPGPGLSKEEKCAIELWVTQGAKR